MATGPVTDGAATSACSSVLRDGQVELRDVIDHLRLGAPSPLTFTTEASLRRWLTTIASIKLPFFSTMPTVSSANTIVVWKPSPFSGAAGSPGPKQWAVYRVDGEAIEGPNWFEERPVMSLFMHGKDPMTYLGEKYANEPDVRIERAARDLGQFHPRLYQGGYVINPPKVFDPHASPEVAAAVSSAEEVGVLVGHLASICRVVTPDNVTDKAYGSEIRNLLLLACTEVEAQLKGVLGANRYPREKGLRMDQDYYRLSVPMKLDEYAVRMTSFRDYAEFRPFEGWRTKDDRLPWYQAYNATKHDRARSVGVATLAHVISAVASLEVLLAAQYGPGTVRPPGFFALTRLPDWDPPQFTHGRFGQRSWEAVPYDFTQ